MPARSLTLPFCSSMAVVAVLTFAPMPAPANDLRVADPSVEREEARELNVLADNALILDRAPGAVVMRGMGRVQRREICLPGADCSRRPTTAGNYLRVTKRAPWIIWMSYIGSVSTFTRDLHPLGDSTAHNVIDIPEAAIPPGGIRIRAFGAGGVTTRIGR